MRTIDDDGLRALVTRMCEGSGAPEFDIVAHPVSEGDLRALRDFRPFPAVDVAGRRRIGAFVGHVVWLDPECPCDYIYAVQPRADEGE